MRRLKKAYLEITNMCNLDCQFCPGTRRTKAVLSPEGFQTLGERLRPHTDYLYLHLMGEPLLHPHLAEILERAEKLKFRVMSPPTAPCWGSGRTCSVPVRRWRRSAFLFTPLRGTRAWERWRTIWPGALPSPGGAPELERSVPCGCGIWTGRTPEERTPGMETF